MLTIDIETVALASSLASEYPAAERNPPGNYSKPDTIAAWRSKDIVDWQEGRIKAYSLNPRFGRILCLGYAIDDAPAEVIMGQSEDLEPELLRDFWRLVKETQNPLVTFNGSFDLSYLLVRSLYHRIAPSINPATVGAWRARYRTSPHFDVRAVLANWDHRTEGTLGEWAAFFGLGSKEGMSGADVYPLFEAGRFDEIAEYCSRDVELTRNLYNRVAPMFGSY